MRPPADQLALTEVRRKLGLLRVLLLDGDNNVNSKVKRAYHNDDAEIIATEIVADLTGTLNSSLLDRNEEWRCAGFTRWYEVLAWRLQRPACAEESWVRPWETSHHPLTAPIAALLLYRRAPGSPVVVSGCRRLFAADMDANTLSYEPMHRCLCRSLVIHILHRDDYLDMHGDIVFRADKAINHSDDGAGEGERQILIQSNMSDLPRLVDLCISYLPYYSADDASFLHGIRTLGAVHRVFRLREDEEENGQHRQQLKHNGKDDSKDDSRDDLDAVLEVILRTLSTEVSADHGRAKYLRSLACLAPRVPEMGLSTRIRLQGVVYSLTQPGGPRYVGSDINRLALNVLDKLFPLGRRTRRAINLAFRSLFALSSLWRIAYQYWVAACLSVLKRLRRLAFHYS
jgi:hypothetical protein